MIAPGKTVLWVLRRKSHGLLVCGFRIAVFVRLRKFPPHPCPQHLAPSTLCTNRLPLCIWYYQQAYSTHEPCCLHVPSRLYACNVLYHSRHPRRNLSSFLTGVEAAVCGNIFLQPVYFVDPGSRSSVRQLCASHNSPEHLSSNLSIYLYCGQRVLEEWKNPPNMTVRAWATLSCMSRVHGALLHVSQ